jgi:hypothetical protein
VLSSHVCSDDKAESHCSSTHHQWPPQKLEDLSGKSQMPQDTKAIFMVEGTLMNLNKRTLTEVGSGPLSKEQAAIRKRKKDMNMLNYASKGDLSGRPS